MAEQLGKVEKPPAERFRLGKKLYLVPLVYLNEDAPPEYRERCERYWQQVEGQLGNLETKIGKVDWVYHESVYESGEAGVKVVEKINPASYRVVRSKCDAGAVLEAIEGKDLVEEAVDWERCILLGFVSERVASKVLELYSEASKKRYEFMAKRISETLQGNEAGLLLIREGHKLQFPSDVEVFSVFPPALDEIHRWVRDRAWGVQGEAKAEKEEPEAREEAEVGREDARATKGAKARKKRPRQGRKRPEADS